MVHDYSQSTAVLNDNDRLVVVMIDSLKLALAFDDVWMMWTMTSAVASQPQNRTSTFKAKTYEGPAQTWGKWEMYIHCCSLFVHACVFLIIYHIETICNVLYI